MSGPVALGTAWVIFILLHPGRGLTDHIIVPVGKEEPERISMLASEESPSAEAVRTTVADGSSACRVASSPATVSLAACSGETLQRTWRKRPSLPTARNVRVSPASIVAFVGTTESAGASCANTTRPVLTMPHARTARPAAHVIFRIRLYPWYFTSSGYVRRGKCESYLGGADFLAGLVAIRRSNVLRRSPGQRQPDLKPRLTGL